MATSCKIHFFDINQKEDNGFSRTHELILRLVRKPPSPIHAKSLISKLSATIETLQQLALNLRIELFIAMVTSAGNITLCYQCKQRSFQDSLKIRAL